MGTAMGRLFGILVALWSFAVSAVAEQYLTFSNDVLAAQVEALFTPDRNFVDTKIAIDGILDPTVDPHSLRAQFESYIKPLHAMLIGTRTDHDKLKVLRHFLYRPGNWNNNLPLAYDHSDPDAKILDHKFLGYLLRTRNGTCSTMPLLVTLVGRRIGLNMTLAYGPKHVLMKFKDSTGEHWNLEATSGAGYTRESYYRAQFHMTDKALANGIYLRTLNDEETTAAMANFLLEWLMKNNRPEDAIIAATVILNHDPKNVFAVLARGSSHTMILRRDILSKYTKRSELTTDQLAYAEALSAANFRDFSAAEALGWTEQDDLKSKSMAP